MKKRIFINIFLTALFTTNCFAKKIDVVGIDDQEILSIIKSSVMSPEKENVISDDSISIEFLIKKDEKIIQDVLASFGYFDAVVDGKMENGVVIFHINKKDRYKLSSVSLKGAKNEKHIYKVTSQEIFNVICIKFDSFTTTQQLSEACFKLKEFFEKRGFAFVQVNYPVLGLDKKKKSVKATFNVDFGEKVVFGNTIIDCDKKLRKLIANRLCWSKGDLYDIDVIEKTKKKLMETGLFSGVDVNIRAPIGGCSDVVVKVQNAKFKDISVGANFGNKDGLGGLFSWSHYNVDGAGSKFTTLTSVSKTTQSQKLKYAMYDPLYKKQRLDNQIYGIRENVVSYSVKKIGSESMLWQTFCDQVDVGAGICTELSKTQDKVEANEKYDRFKAVGFPIGINFDTTKNYLDPQSGFRGTTTLVPYVCKQRIISFASKYSAYVPLSKNKFDNNFVLACYCRFCLMFFDRKDKLPRDKLFFAGGANSVRGYGYQLLGDVNDEKKPVGGKSVFEAGFEYRAKVSENVGIVAFLEGGNVYKSSFPKIGKNMLYGGGIGVRYYTPLGLIRFDMAAPFKQRRTSDHKKIDSFLNLYISIGQAF